MFWKLFLLKIFIYNYLVLSIVNLIGIDMLVSVGIMDISGVIVGIYSVLIFNVLLLVGI